MLHEPAGRVGAGVHRHPPGAGGQHLRLHALRDHRENIRLIFVGGRRRQSVDDGFDGIELCFGVALQHVGIAVAVHDDRTGAADSRRVGRLCGDQSGQLRIGISGDQQPRVGARRQAEAIFDLLNCAFVWLAGTALQIAQAHGAYASGGRQVREGPVTRLAKCANGRAADSRLTARSGHKPDTTRIRLGRGHPLCIYVFIAILLQSPPQTYTLLPMFRSTRRPAHGTPLRNRPGTMVRVPR